MKIIYGIKQFHREIESFWLLTNFFCYLDLKYYFFNITGIHKLRLQNFEDCRECRHLSSPLLTNLLHKLSYLCMIWWVGGSLLLLDSLNLLLLKVDPPGWSTPLWGFPKIFGNKNAIILKNAPEKIWPPFRNLGLCSTDPPHQGQKKSHTHVCKLFIWVIPLA